MVPLILAFDTQHFRTYTDAENNFIDKINWFGNVIMVYFIMDILFKFNLSFYDEDGNLVKSRVRIRKNYMSFSGGGEKGEGGGFWIDLFISFPYAALPVTE